MILTLALPQRVTQDEAQATCDGLLALVQTQPGPIVIDASALREFDTAALAVITTCQRAAIARGVELTVQGLPEQAQTLARVYGVSQLLG